MRALAASCDVVQHLLDDYLDGELPPEETARCEEHLGACPGCTATRGEAEAARALVRGLRDDGISEESRAQALAGFRAASARRCAEHALQPPGRADPAVHLVDDIGRLAGRCATAGHEAIVGNQLLSDELSDEEMSRLANLSGSQAVGLCEELLRRSYARRFDDPRMTLELARRAERIARGLQPTTHDRQEINDLGAKAVAHVGNALRVLGDLPAADRTLAEASALLRGGTRQPGLRAQLDAFRGELRRAQRRFGDALRLYDRAVSRCRSHALYQDVATWLVGKANVQHSAGDAEGAIKTLHFALLSMDPTADVKIMLAARHNLACYLLDAGRTREAQRHLEQLRPLYRESGDRMTQIRLRWTEGKLFMALGQYEQAQRAFLEVRDGYVQREMSYDAALASLDLATAHASQGNAEAMKQLAAEMLPIFLSLAVHREAIAALLVFQQAAEMEAVSLGLIKELAAYFEKASKNPALPFRSDS
jgi:tetratricopeptide (TPR) repeat protein